MNGQQRSPLGTARLAALDTVSVSIPASITPGPQRPEGSAPATGAVAVLEILRGPATGHRFTLDPDTVTVLGRHPGCEIVLSSVTVSRRHAEIRPTPTGFVLTDTGSLNGSYLNDTPVDTATLTDGDDIQLGIFRLVFHHTGADDDTSTAPSRRCAPAGE